MPTATAAKAKKAAAPVDKKAAAAPAKVATPKAQSAEMPICMCGCGKQTKGRTFLQGHDMVFKSLVLKIRRGEEKLGALSGAGQKYFKQQGFAPGDLADSKGNGGKRKKKK